MNQKLSVHEREEIVRLALQGEFHSTIADWKNERCNPKRNVLVLNFCGER